MKALLTRFANGEGGAVTTEFVVLCAAAGALGVIGFVSMPEGSVEANADHEVAIESFVSGFDD